MTPLDYRRPSDLQEGGVLEVGVSATGVQLADEIHRSGRPVTVSVGEHVRMLPVYRGKDIRYWFEVTGLADERYDEVDDIVRARPVPSPQLVGTPQRLMLDLNDWPPNDCCVRIRPIRRIWRAAAGFRQKRRGVVASEASPSHTRNSWPHFMHPADRLPHGHFAVVSSYVKIGVGFGGWRWVQMRSEIRLLRTRMASLWVFPRVMSFW